MLVLSSLSLMMDCMAWLLMGWYMHRGSTALVWSQS